MIWLWCLALGCRNAPWLQTDPTVDSTSPTGTALDTEVDPPLLTGEDFGCGPGLRPGPSNGLARWPYLQSVTDSSAIVVWGTKNGLEGTVRWGADPADLANELVGEPLDIEGRDSEPLRLFSATITGLAPETAYCYAVQVDGVERISGLQLRTAPSSASASVDFLAFGDYGDDTDAQIEIRDQIQPWLSVADLWFTTGDNAYGAGSYDDLQENVFDIYEDQWHRVPVFPTLGNADYVTDDGEPYLQTFFLPENALRPEDAERYYSLDWGPIHYVGFDSNDPMFDVDPKSTDDIVDWLEADLAATDRPWKIVAWHHPPYEGHPTRSGDVLTLQHVVPVLERHGVQLVLNGHNHCYERSKPILEGAASTLADGGVTYVIVGSGGRALYPVEEWELQEVGISQYNFMVGHVDECTLEAEVYDHEGGELDRFTMDRCP